MKSKQNEMYLNTETMLSLFDTYVRSVINYWCEIWGFHNGKDVEKVQLQYLKTLLGVKKNTYSAVVYCETGRFQIVRLFRILKFWFKLLQSQNCILYTCYNMFREEFDHSKKSLNIWVTNLKNKLCEIGLCDFWLKQDNINVNLHFPVDR